MVTFEPDEEQTMVRDTAREFANRELRPKAAERDRTSTFPLEEMRKLAELGLLGVAVPEQYGGSGSTTVAYSLAITELARGCPATTVTASVTNMVAELICHYGTEAQKQRYVPMICSGEAVSGAFALSEPQCGSDASALRTTASKRSDGGWVLNGTKQWISHGDHSKVIVVWARTADGQGAKGISAFIVENGTPGLIVGKHEDKMGLRGSTTVPLTFEDCEIPADALLGGENDGFRLAMTALDGGRIGVSSQALGIGFEALAEARSYALERKAFGKPLGNLQAIQWYLADCATELDAARLLLLRAAMLKDRKVPFTREASMAKLYAAETANRVCYKVLQIHGGYGYTKDYAIERLTRDVRVTTIYEGTSEIQRLVIARSLLKD